MDAHCLEGLVHIVDYLESLRLCGWLLSCIGIDRHARLDNPERTAEAVGLSAVVVQDLKTKRVKGYKFDWNRVLKAEGDTGPFLQCVCSQCARNGNGGGACAHCAHTPSPSNYLLHTGYPVCFLNIMLDGLCSS